MPPKHPPKHLSLFCVIINDEYDDDNTFKIQVKPTDYISDLKDQIFHKRNQEFPSANMTVWKLNCDVSNAEVYERIKHKRPHDDEAKKMRPMDKISVYFPNSPPEGQIHIAVLRPTISLSRDVPQPEPKRKAIGEIDLDYIDEKIKDLQSPSDMSTNWRQVEHDPTFHNHRPLGAYGFPTELMHPLFGQFIDEYDNVQPTLEMYHFTVKLCSTLARYYRTEKLMGEEVRKLFLDPPFRLYIHSENIDTYGVDGVWCPVVDQGFFGMILEYKLGYGIEGDPHIQSTAYYARYLERYYAFLRTQTALAPPRLPCFLVSVSGPYISITFAINGRFIMVDHHIPILLLASPLYKLEKLASALTALKNGIDRMREYYNTPPQGDTQHHFPFPRSFKWEGTDIHFSYDVSLHMTPILCDNFSRLVFLVTVDSSRDDLPEKLIVKFAQKYPSAIHEECAAQGIAPKLYSSTELPGGWCMVVMEYVGSMTIKEMEDKAMDQNEVGEALQKLHSLGYVYGDIRKTNIAIRSGDNAVVFIDWDWAGKDGVVSYPLKINPEIRRHPTALGGGPILREHDLFALSLMFSE